MFLFERIDANLTKRRRGPARDIAPPKSPTRDGRHLERNMDSSRESLPYRRDSHQSLSLSLCTLLSVSLLSARLVVGDQCQTQTFILLLVLLLPLALHSFFLLFAPFCDKELSAPWTFEGNGEINVGKPLHDVERYRDEEIQERRRERAAGAFPVAASRD